MTSEFKLIEHVIKEDLNGDLLLIAELCGIETALLIAENLSGCSLYIPSAAFIKTKKRLCKQLKAKGYKIKQIAKLLDLSERAVSKYL